MNRPEKPHSRGAWEFVTPELAREYLKKNTRNRALVKSSVARYARDIAAGNWDYENPQPISFAPNGRLIDGQTRLEAIVLAAIGIWLWVQRDVSEAAGDRMDTGVIRNGAHLLDRHGYKNTRCLAAAINAAMEIRGMKQLTTKVEQTALLEYVQTYPAIEESVSQTITRQKTVNGFMPPASVAAIHHLFAEKDAKAADEFFDKLLIGDNLSKTDPVFLLRARLIANAGSVAKLPKRTVNAFLIKTWNAVRSGRKVNCLKWQDDEPFPTVAD